jgi:hypothetical protein
MSFSTKLFPMLALVVSLAPLSAHARNSDPRVTHQASFLECWATNFGFQPTNCKPAVCTRDQKGFWPRLNDCVN